MTAMQDHDVLVEVTRRARELTDPLLRAAVDRMGPELAGIGGYHFGWCETGAPGGKSVRPALAVLAAEAVGGTGEQAAPAAAAVELVHNFSLVHDDIIDHDERRRGRPSVWAVHGVPAAILIGDALQAAAFEVLLGAGPRASATGERLAVALREVVVGQVQDIGFTGRPWLGPDAVTRAEYQAMAEAKTGALLSFAACAGAELAGADEAAVAAFDRLARHLGLAFQCTDDVLGIWGDPAVTGKPVHGDLREGKRSLPVIAALSTGGPAAAELAALLDDPEADLELTARIVEDRGGRQFAEQEAARHLAAVAAALDELTVPPPVRTALDALTGSLIGRTR
ncbi:polyprenyl synthetase family protein [Saccharopolyspora sp. CA-218241]|uniref:polyprenyl synthetase family protein n=1 Tax=Saccharopolyspora sp. CA-218241 TaxID=3240027 RepID=UPI003D977A5D